MSDQRWSYIGVGTNLGDRAANLRGALRLLQERLAPTSLEISNVYATAPRMDLDQATFLNAVIRLRLDDAPLDLLRQTQAIEAQMGRVKDPTRPKGPRIIDLDLLSVGRRILNTPELELPHPGIALRLFVLRPWADLAPEWSHPVTGETIAQMLAKTPDLGEIALWASSQEFDR